MPTPEELTIPDKLDSINVTKQAIRQAIADKGVEVPEGTTFYEYAGKIAEIETGSNIKTCEVEITVTGYSDGFTVLYTSENEKDISNKTIYIPFGETVAVTCIEQSIISIYGSTFNSYPIVNGGISVVGNYQEISKPAISQASFSFDVSSSGSINVSVKNAGGSGSEP